MENKIRKVPKRIIFNISDEDHEAIKHEAAKRRVSMRHWIIDAMAERIKRDKGQLNLTE